MVGPDGWTTRINEQARSRMDPTPAPGHRSSPHQRLPPTRKTPPTTGGRMDTPNSGRRADGIRPTRGRADGARDPDDPPVYDEPPDDDERAVEEPTPPDRTITAQDWIDAWAPDEPSAPDQTCSPHDPPVYEAPPADDERAVEEPTPPDSTITAQDWIDAWHPTTRRHPTSRRPTTTTGFANPATQTHLTKGGLTPPNRWSRRRPLIAPAMTPSAEEAMRVFRTPAWGRA